MQMEKVERDLIVRTLQVIEQYHTYVLPQVPPTERFEVTLIINCLLSLLVLPRELWFAKVEALPLDQLQAWGLPSTVVESWGQWPPSEREPKRDLRELIRRMRNSVCHMGLEVLGTGTSISHLRFKDDHGFSALVPEPCLRPFVTKLAESVLAV